MYRYAQELEFEVVQKEVDRIRELFLAQNQEMQEGMLKRYVDNEPQTWVLEAVQVWQRHR